MSVTNAVVASPAFKQSALTLFAPLVSSVKDYNSRVVFWHPSPEQEMQYIFSYFDKLGIKSVGIAYQESEFNQEMYQYVVAEVSKRKMSLSGVARISNSPVENEKEATALAAKNPGIVIVVSDTVGRVRSGFTISSRAASPGAHPITTVRSPGLVRATRRMSLRSSASAAAVTEQLLKMATSASSGPSAS